MKTNKIKRGDKVKIVSGKDKGREGVVEKVFPRKATVLVSGVNLYKKHARARGAGKPGGIIDITKPLPVAKVALICPRCGRQTRVGYQLSKEEKKQTKTRFCKKCKETI